MRKSSDSRLIIALYGLPEFGWGGLEADLRSAGYPVRAIEEASRLLSPEESSRTAVAWIGFGSWADRLAKDYYSFYRICPPQACVLLSSSVRTIHLNNLTCPYLALYGARDPVLESLPFSAIQSAIHHHQMRYGDVTTAEAFQTLGKDLGGLRSRGEVNRQILYWLKLAQKTGYKRPQEPGAASAA